MHRLFLALRPPGPIRDLLAATMHGVAGVRWQDDDQLHLTVRYIGEVDGRTAEDVAVALGGIDVPAVTARIAGVGAFANALWAGVAPAEPLAALHRKADRALAAAGLEPERRAYRPHVTLGRMPRSMAGSVEVRSWQVRHAALASDPISLDRLVLYESRLGREGASYEAVAFRKLA